MSRDEFAYDILVRSPSGSDIGRVTLPKDDAERSIRQLNQLEVSLRREAISLNKYVFFDNLRDQKINWSMAEILRERTEEDCGPKRQEDVDQLEEDFAGFRQEFQDEVREYTMDQCESVLIESLKIEVREAS